MTGTDEILCALREISTKVDRLASELQEFRESQIRHEERQATHDVSLLRLEDHIERDGKRIQALEEARAKLLGAATVGGLLAGALVSALARMLTR